MLRLRTGHSLIFAWLPEWNSSIGACWRTVGGSEGHQSLTGYNCVSNNQKEKNRKSNPSEFTQISSKVI